MNTISLWKRVGGWLRRSPGPIGTTKVVHVDAEGMLVESAQHPQTPEEQELITEPPRSSELASLEKGFGRLVEVLESINQNVQVQSTQGADLKEQMNNMGKWLKSLPDPGLNQTALKDLTEEIQKHSLRNQQLMETVGVLPQLTQEQVEKLAEITQQLETSGQNNQRLNDSFQSFDGTVKSVLQSSKQQSSSMDTMTGSLGNMTENLQKNEQRLQEILNQQNRRLILMFGIFAVISLALIGSIVALILLRN
ncbi:MAG: hypothetical protein GY869_24150 [Planctomycetes bacterium]|nr:hypothetical protein [Planctomycetota bacterium]